MNNNKEIELIAVLLNSDVSLNTYKLYYRLKNPIEKPKNFWDKIFNRTRYYSNKWKVINKFHYSKYHPSTNWIYDSPPEKQYYELLINDDQLEEYKNKFKTLQDVKDYENAEYNRMKSFIPAYHKKIKPDKIKLR